MLILIKICPSFQQLKAIPKLCYACHLWYAKIFQAVREKLTVFI